MSIKKHLLVFGAGKSATVLIDYLKKVVAEKQWELTVADGNFDVVRQKLGNQPGTNAVQLDILDVTMRTCLIEKADIVISLMPPALHLPIAEDCLTLGKHLLTASYVDPKIRQMEDAIKSKGLLFLCEMGLDPGIDHMSAMQIIHRIKTAGGYIESFYSHCGGLVAPESDDNPWHYKISWNPQNVVLAGKAGAVYREHGAVKELSYETLFQQATTVKVPSVGTLSYYANRDSLSYMGLYHLPGTKNFLRTTLRYPDFCKGWAAIVALKLTDETVLYDTDRLTVNDFLQKHLQQYRLHHLFDELMSDELIRSQFEFLGLFADTIINKGQCSAAAILQWRMEQSWVLKPDDKDMIVMLHEITYVLHEQQHVVKSSLVVKGEDHLRTAMAKTVGLPLAIAAVLIAEDKLRETGLHIPIIPSIYEPVLAVLAEEGIVFNEE